MSARNVLLSSFVVLALGSLAGCGKKTDWSTKPLTSQEKKIKEVAFTVDMPTDGFEEDTLLKLDNQLAYIEKGNVPSGIHVSFSVFKNLQPESADDAEKEVNMLGDRKTLKKDKLGDGFIVATTNDKKTSLYVDTWTPANDDYSIRCSAYDTESSEIKNAAALQGWFEKICSSVKSKVAAGPKAAGGGGSTGSAGSIAGGKLPEGWPDAIPVIEGGSVKSQMSSASGKTTTLSATIESAQSTDDLLKFYSEKITAAGYKESSKTESKVNDSVTKSISYQKGKYGADGSVNLRVMPSFMSKGKSSAMISVTLMKK
jgi:hypothetical protein